MSSRAPRPHFFQPELPPVVDWRPRRRWPLGVTVQRAALRHLRRLLAQREGVWADEDPEAVHRIRVATRRLRSTLQTFAALWPAEDVARWNRELGRFAAAFGEARDLDVQLASLGGAADDASRLAEARVWMAAGWRARRADLTDDLRRTLVRFERSWTPQRLMEFFSTRPLDLWAWCAEQDPARMQGGARDSAGANPGRVAAAPLDDAPRSAEDPGPVRSPHDTSTAAGSAEAAEAADPAAPGESADPGDAPGPGSPSAGATGEAAGEPAGERRPPRPPARRTPRA